MTGYSLRLRLFSMLGAALVVSLGSCTPKDDNPTQSGGCSSNVDFVGNPPSSPAAGALTLHGNFYPEESVLLGYTDPATGQTRTAVGTPPDQRTVMTLTGLPSGTRTYLISLSCSDGTHIVGQYSFTVK